MYLKIFIFTFYEKLLALLSFSITIKKNAVKPEEAFIRNLNRSYVKTEKVYKSLVSIEENVNRYSFGYMFENCPSHPEFTNRAGT